MSQLTDPTTGVVMRLRRLPSAVVQIDIEGGTLEVRKTVHANGDFRLVMRDHNDLLVVTRRAAQVSVVRRNRAVEFGVDALAEADLDQLQYLLAGSSAVRQFRALKSRLAASTRGTLLGAAAAVIDAQLGVLNGEPPAPIAMAPSAESVTASAAAAVDGEGGGDPSTCYAQWEREVIAAWNDFEECVASFAWYNPVSNLCAFAWTLRTESAWFRFLSCSAIPVKV